MGVFTDSWQRDFVATMKELGTTTIITDLTITAKQFPILTQYLKQNYEEFLSNKVFQILRLKAATKNIARRY